jgi:hypothetical protein
MLDISSLVFMMLQRLICLGSCSLNLYRDRINYLTQLLDALFCGFRIRIAWINFTIVRVEYITVVVFLKHGERWVFIRKVRCGVLGTGRQAIKLILALEM